MRNYYLTTLITVLLSTYFNININAQDPPLLDNISIIDAEFNQHREYMEVGEGKTDDVSFWEGINFRLNTTPDVIGNYRLTVEIFKDGASTPYWTKSRVANPYCAFASTASFEYSSWKEDAEAFGQAPPVPGSYSIKFTLTGTDQVPTPGVEPFERNFTITPSTSIDKDILRQIKVWSSEQQIIIDSPNNTIYEVLIYGLSGKLLQHNVINSFKYSSNVSLPVGVYIVKLKFDKQFICKKVAIQ